MLKCPFCKKEFKSVGSHMYKCKLRTSGITDNEVLISYFKCNYGENIISEVINDYVNHNYSLPMIKEKYNIPYRAISNILLLGNIKTRSISESQILITVEKAKKTCQKKYGCDNPSQSKEIKDKKASTFLKHFGVDNIWKTKKYAEFTSNRWKSYTIEEKNRLLNKCFLKKGCVSLIEDRVFNVLCDLNIDVIRQFKFKNFYHKYDFKIKNTKILIEINGDFWHANPCIYKENDVLHFSKTTNYTTKQLWEKDKSLNEVAQKNDYIVITIWENEIKKISDDNLKILIINKLNNLKNYE